MKFCQGLHKSDKLYDKIMDLEVKSWASAQDIIKKYAERQALKADLVESAAKAQGQMLMKLEGGGGQSPTRRPSSQSLGRDKKKPDPGSQRQSRERDRGGEKQKGGRSASNSRECWGCQEIVTGDYSSNCPKAKKEESGRPMTPYP